MIKYAVFFERQNSYRNTRPAWMKYSKINFYFITINTYFVAVQNNLCAAYEKTNTAVFNSMFFSHIK